MAGPDTGGRGFGELLPGFPFPRATTSQPAAQPAITVVRPSITASEASSHRRWQQARARQRKPRVLRAPSVPTATPLVRPDRVHVTRQAVTRRARIHRLQANAPVLVKPPRPTILRGAIARVARDVRAVLVRAHKHHAPQIIRPFQYAATATPLVRNRIAVRKEALYRKARVLRASANKPLELRAPSAPTATALIRPDRIHVTHEARIRKTRVIRSQQNKPTILRAPVVAAAASPAHQPQIHTTRRSRYIRAQANKPICLRARSTPTATPLVRNTVHVSREALLRRSRWTCLGHGRRIKPRLLYPPRGGATAVIVPGGSTFGLALEQERRLRQQEEEKLALALLELV